MHTHVLAKKNNTIVIDAPENIILDTDYLPVWFDGYVFSIPAYSPCRLSYLEYSQQASEGELKPAKRILNSFDKMSFVAHAVDRRSNSDQNNLFWP